VVRAAPRSASAAARRRRFAQERGAQHRASRQARRTAPTPPADGSGNLHRSEGGFRPAARAKQARNRASQAILPLGRGQILNVASAGKDKLAQNQQLADLVQALGCAPRHYREGTCATKR